MGQRLAVNSFTVTAQYHDAFRGRAESRFLAIHCRTLTALGSRLAGLTALGSRLAGHYDFDTVCYVGGLETWFSSETAAC